MSGKVIAVTGANGGLGRALAQQFVRDGEQVVLLGRSLAKVKDLADALGDAAMAIACNVSNPASVRKAFAEIATIHPKLDVLINNAGIFQPFLIEEATDEQLVNGVLTNLLGPMLCARSAIALMDRGALIINVSSESVALPYAHLLVYQSTKAGLERFSIGLQDELEGQGIRTCIVRAGQMMGDGFAAQLDPTASARFVEATMKRSPNLLQRAISRYESAVELFQTVINLPTDIHVGMVSFHAKLLS